MLWNALFMESAELNIGLEDWRDQLRNALRTPKDLERAFKLTLQERAGLEALARAGKGGLPLLITPHYAGLIDPEDPNDPLRLQVVPRASEFEDAPQMVHDLRRDPLGEEDHEVVPHLIHRYPDRVLLFATDRCASYCRFCTRKRWVGQGPTPSIGDLEQAIQYIENHKEVWEVILSGGDPLLLSDERLKSILDRLARIRTVQVVRLHTRLITFAPMRATPSFVEMLRAHQREHRQAVYVVGHTNHVREIAPATEQAFLALADAGISVLNHTVLLRGINDDAKTLTELFRKLVTLRVRPYYLHQCDLAPGTTAFRVPIDRAIALQKELRGHVSGLCQPTFVLDIPGGYGKVPLISNPIVRTDDSHHYLEGFDGEVAAYPRD
jgi:lysine 2,3-aminomutase